MDDLYIVKKTSGFENGVIRECQVYTLMMIPTVSTVGIAEEFPERSESAAFSFVFRNYFKR